MARPRQPIELVKAKGKKHLTKEEIKQREKTEIKAPNDNIVVPSYLNQELKKEFIAISDELIKIGIMTNLDTDALARFIIAKKMYIELTLKLLEQPELLLLKDSLINQDKLFKQCRAAASDLGLTISSRCKLVMPKKDEEKPKNKFAQFL